MSESTPSLPESFLDDLQHSFDDPEWLDVVEEAIRERRAMPDGARKRATTGKLDPRNMLNDLTGAEWVFFLNSVEVTAYPTKGPDGFAHDIRKVHPSPKPPQLMKKIIKFFSQKGQWVLDPFAGVGGTLLGASLCERNAIGIDLEPRYLDIYQAVCEREKQTPQAVLNGDAMNVVELVRGCPGAPEQIDLIVTDPPYGDMLARPQTGEVKKRTGKSVATPFTELSHDLGNMGRADFLPALREVMERSVSLLRPRGYCIVFCKDLQPTAEHHNMLHADVVSELSKIPGLSFKGYKIWYDKTITLYPFGYPYSFVANQLHQYILVFRKEK